MSPAESGPHKGYFTDPDLLSRWDLVIVMMMMVITILNDDCSESELQIVFVIINSTRRVPGLLLTLGGIYLGLGLFACLIITQVSQCLLAFLLA